MKVLIYTDVHWSQNSSIIRDMGDKYSIRLEHLIDSINWAENLAIENNCDMVLNLGDFFDRSTCNGMEIAALSEIKWANIPHKVLVGNHELISKNTELSSVHMLKLLGFDIITKPEMIDIDKYTLCFLPYMFEYSSIKDIFPTDKERIVFSHNDITGLAFSTKGFDREDIKKNCRLFVNGHLHNRSQYDNLYNIGNLCGQNFGEDGTTHNAYILDTDTNRIQAFENPYSFNFYKLDFTQKINWPNLKPNPVLSIKCCDNIEEISEHIDKIVPVAVKYIIVPKTTEVQQETEDIIQIDHLQSLREYIFNKLGEDDIIKEEVGKLIS